MDLYSRGTLPASLTQFLSYQAWHEGSETRLVLIVDIWHPDLSDAEVDLATGRARQRTGRWW